MGQPGADKPLSPHLVMLAGPCRITTAHRRSPRCAGRQVCAVHGQRQSGPGRVSTFARSRASWGFRHLSTEILLWQKRAHTPSTRGKLPARAFGRRLQRSKRPFPSSSLSLCPSVIRFQPCVGTAPWTGLHPRCASGRELGRLSCRRPGGLSVSCVSVLVCVPSRCWPSLPDASPYPLPYGYRYPLPLPAPLYRRGGSG